MLKSIVLGSALVLGVHWVSENYPSQSPPLSIDIKNGVEDIGQRIKLARLAAHLSVHALAQRVSISSSELEDIERGRLFPSQHLVKKINAALSQS